jgi:hypothetical protein
MKIIAEDNKEYDYCIEQNGIGYSISTIPIQEEIKSKLFVINYDDIGNEELLKQNKKIIESINIGIEELVGKYYDKNGFIYYNIESTIYRFILKLTYFKKLYKSKINGV